MKNKKKKQQVERDGEIVITRVFDAPREKAWKTWTDPERVKCWWGPKGFTVPSTKSDLRVGGSYLYSMRSPEGRDYWSTGVFQEITPSKRIVATDSFADEKGNVVPASHYGMRADWPIEALITANFEKQGDKTKLILEHNGLPGGKDSEMAKAGWNESLDRFAACLG
jgi:uncharacterized protein YndB with AHSA1/START domain